MTLIQAKKRRAELVTTATRMRNLVASLRGEAAIAVDTESNGFHRYPERVCLVQIGVPGVSYIIDPVTIDDILPLGELLADPDVQKIIHSADYDLRSLDREWGFGIRNLYDTSVAAHFAGLDRLGLSNTLEQFLAVTLSKEKKLQRADWSMRPLSREALDYAADDVAYLLPLREVLDAKLGELGRADWVREECERLEDLRYTPPEPPGEWVFSMRGSRKLDDRGLAVLQKLILMREREARRRNRPPFRILSDEALLTLAENPKTELGKVHGLTDVVLHRIGKDLRQALIEGQAAPPIKRPPPERPARKPPTKNEQERFQKLRTWRMEQGKRLELDPALVWPMPSLERLARDPGSLDAELRSTEVRRWQAKAFSDSLRKDLARL
ncbi:MAG: HRDC domain-containing protein [Chloroflexi bacterium]|nr:HRDC domain-containing protein [Chloroflexota bacterium]